MNKFKEGDIVKPHDGSYAVTINEDGRKEDIHGINIIPSKFEIIGIDCDLPARVSNPDERNNTILRALDNNQIVFIQSRMVTLVHRCDCCPSCGKEI